MRISFGINVHGETFPERVSNRAEAWNSYSFSYSGLHGFEVNIGTDAGIVSKGALVVDDSPDNFGFYGQDRSVMVNDALFYIKGSSVSAAHWDSLESPSPAR